MREADKVLLDLLGNALFNVPVEIPENLDWTVLYMEAKVQAVLPLAFDAAAISTEIAAKRTQACVQYAFQQRTASLRTAVCAGPYARAGGSPAWF